MIHNQDSKVKVPPIRHLTRLGYKYISLKEANWDTETNIFTEIFALSLANINDGVEEDGI